MKESAGRAAFLLIRNADVCAPEEIGLRDLLICGERIAVIGEHLSYDFPDMQVLDVQGKKLVPGFLDQHVHITGGGGESSFRSRIREIDVTDILESGVTTVVGLLGTDGLSRSIENLVAKTKALNEDGITARCLTGSYALPSVTLTGSVARDIAFVQEVIGVKVAITDHRSSMPTRQELSRLASQVRVASMLSGKAGILCMHTGTGKTGLSDVMAVVEESDLPIRHFRPTHVGHLLDDAVQFANMGGMIDFTSGSDPQKTAEQIRWALERAPLEQMTISSDSNGSAPVWNEKRELIGMGVGKMDTLWETVRTLIVGGMAASEALKLITENVARGLELYPVKGHIAPGADADLVVLDPDWRVDTVIARGRCRVRDRKVLEAGYYTY